MRERAGSADFRHFRVASLEPAGQRLAFLMRPFDERYSIWVRRVSGTARRKCWVVTLLTTVFGEWVSPGSGYQVESGGESVGGVFRLEWVVREAILPA